MAIVRPSITGLAAASIAAAIAVLYVVLMAQEQVGDGGQFEPQVLIWAVVFFALPLCAAAGSMLPPSATASALLAVAALGMLVLGIVAGFSIGLPLLPASALAWVALATRRQRA